MDNIFQICKSSNSANELSVFVSGYPRIVFNVQLQRQILRVLLWSGLICHTKCFSEGGCETNKLPHLLFHRLWPGRDNYFFTENAESYEVQQDYETISYTIYARLLPSNTQIVLAEISGEPLISLSAGTNLYSGKQKINKLALNEMTRKLVIKSRMLEATGVFSVSMGGIRKHRSILLTRLKDIYPIKVIKINNLTPHNGCRSKKLRK